MSSRYTASIIMPVFNKAELTAQCVAALAEVTQGVDYELIVVDNASRDGTGAFLSSLSGDVQVITNAENLGFAVACNQGAKAARGRYLVFLNNDTVPLPGWLEALVAEVEAHPEVAAVGSKLLYEDGTVQHAGVVFARESRHPFHPFRLGRADLPEVNQRRELQAVTAACVLIRREVFEELGAFDEEFRNGWEDLDLCMRMRSRGWKIVYQPASVLYHLESQSPGRKKFNDLNRDRFFEKWKGHLLSDEDAYFVAFGCAPRYGAYGKRKVGRVVRFSSPEEAARWQVVARFQELAAAGERDGARALLRDLERWPEEAAVLRWAGVACAWVGLPEEGQRFWERSLELEESPEIRAAIARVLLECGKLDRAEVHVRILLEHAPVLGDAWILKATLAMQRRSFSEAASAYETALLNGAPPRKALVGQAMAVLCGGDATEAWFLLTAALEEEPGDPLALHWLLAAGSELGHWEELSSYLERFLAAREGDAAARFALGGVYLRLGRVEDAREAYARLEDQHPGYPGLADLAQALEQAQAA
jgi:GT2 family glycosyltransferase/tetratricopeptide (TPR) repeat protein